MILFLLRLIKCFNKWIVPLFLFLFRSFTYGEMEIKNKTEFQAYEYYRKIDQNGISSRDHAYDTFLRIGTEWRIQNGPWQLEFKPEVYGFYGDSISTEDNSYRQIPSIENIQFFELYQLNINSPKRFFNWRKKISSQKYWNLETEKLNLTYLTDHFELTLGRRPFSLGVLKIFPIWNKFSRPLPINQGPTTTWSSDLFSLRIPGENSSSLIAFLGGETSQDHIYLGEYTYYQNDWESHFLISNWWKKNVIGLAFAKDLWGASWKLEALRYNHPSDPTDHGDLLGVGVEYAMNEKSSILSEFLYQSRAAKNKNQYFTTSVSKFEVFHAQIYNFTQIQYKMTDFLTSQLAFLINGIDQSQYWILKTQYSFSDQTDFYFEINCPTGQRGAEFSHKVIELPLDKYLGSTKQISIGFKSVY